MIVVCGPPHPTTIHARYVFTIDVIHDDDDDGGRHDDEPAAFTSSAYYAADADDEAHHNADSRWMGYLLGWSLCAFGCL